MKIFQLEITETLQRIVEVKAKSEDEALKIVSEKYKNEQIVLDSSDFLNKEINFYLYSKNYEKLYENEKFKYFVLKEAESIITHMSIEELTKLAFGDISFAKKEFDKKK